MRWTWLNLPYVSTDSGAGRAGQAAGRQDVVGARGVVAGRFGRPRPDEQRAGVAEPGDRRLERLDVDRQVLRSVGVDEVDRRVQVRREDDPAVVAQRGGEDVVTGGARELGGDGRLDRVGEGGVRRDQDRRRIGAVLGLGDEVGGDTRRASAGGAARTIPSDGPAGQVDADLAADLDLGRGHPRVARTDDPIDGFDAGVRQPVGEGTDRLRPAGDDEGIDLEEAGGAEQDRVGRPGRGRQGRPRRSRSTPATRAGTTVMTSDDGYGAEPPGT